MVAEGKGGRRNNILGLCYPILTSQPLYQLFSFHIKFDQFSWSNDFTCNDFTYILGRVHHVIFQEGIVCFQHFSIANKAWIIDCIIYSLFLNQRKPSLNDTCIRMRQRYHQKLWNQVCPLVSHLMAYRQYTNPLISSEISTQH